MPSYSVHTIINDMPFSVINNLTASCAYTQAIRPEMLGIGWVTMLKYPALTEMANLKETQLICIAHTIDNNEQILIVRQTDQ